MCAPPLLQTTVTGSSRDLESRELAYVWLLYGVADVDNSYAMRGMLCMNTHAHTRVKRLNALLDDSMMTYTSPVTVPLPVGAVFTSGLLGTSRPGLC